MLLPTKSAESAANKAIHALAYFYALDGQIELCPFLNFEQKCISPGITPCPLKEKRNN